MLFADDTIIFYSHENIDYMISTLNKDVEKLSVWLRKNKLSLNLTIGLGLLTKAKKTADLILSYLLTINSQVK